MAIELAAAYLSVVPSLRGAQKTIQAELSGIDLAPVGQKLGGGLLGGIGKGMSGLGGLMSSAGGAMSALGGTLTNAITKPALGAAAVVGGVFASFIPEAARASDATDKFRSTLQFAGLKTSKIDALTASTKKYADETVYELSDIQSVTAQLAANGVKGYDSMAEALGNLNAVAGGNAETFGQVALATTQVNATGKLMTQDWNQIANAIPGASGKLQDAMKKNGAYTGNFRDAMAKGEITAEEFNQAVRDLGMTDVAREAATSTKTFEGAIGNLQASIVSGLMRPIDAIKPALTTALGGLSTLLGPVFDVIGKKAEAFAPKLQILAEQFAAWAEGVDVGQVVAALDAVQGTIGKVVAAAVLIGPAFSVFGAITSKLGGFVSLIGRVASGVSAAGGAGKVLQGVVSRLLGPVGLVITALVAMWTNSEVFRNAVMTLGQQLLVVGQQIWEALAPALAQLEPLFAQLAPLFAELAQIVGDAVGGIISDLTPVITFILGQLAPVFTFLADMVGEAMKVILAVLKPAIAAIKSILGAVMAAIRGDWSGAWGHIKDAVRNVWTMIKTLVSGGINYVKTLISKGVALVKTIWANVWSAIGAKVTATWSSIKSGTSSAINAVVGFVRGLPGKAAAAAAALGSKLKAKASEAWNLLKAATRLGIDTAVGLVRDLPNKAAAALGGIGSRLVSSGRALIDGFISGIRDAFGRARQVVSDGLASIRDFFPFSPAKKGPFSGKGWVTYAGKSVGTAFTKAIAKSLADGQPAVLKVLDGLNKSLAKAGDDAIKDETKRLQKARRDQNKKISSSNAKLAKQRTKKLAAADKIKDSKARKARKAEINKWYQDNKKKSLGALDAIDAGKQAKKNLKKPLAQIKSAEAIAKAQGKLTKTLWDDGKYKGAVKRWQGLNQGTVALLKGLKASGAIRKDATKAVKGATLADIAKAQQQVTGALNAAKATLADLTKARDDLKASVASSLMGELDLGAVTGEGSGKLTFEGVAVQVSGLLAKVKKFASKLKKLGEMGIPPALVQEVAALGTEKGIQVADALLSGTKTQVKALAADWSSLNSYSSRAGSYVADGLYKAGIDAQQGLVNGLLADSKKLDAAAKTLADKVTKAVKKALGIKSPSTVMRDQVGAWLAPGIADGIDPAPAVSAMRDLSAAVVGAWQPGELSGRYTDPGAVDRTGMTVNVHNQYPIAEPTSVTVDRALTTAGVMGL